MSVSLAAPLDLCAQSRYGSDEVNFSLSRKGSTVKNWSKKPNSNPESVKLFNDFFDQFYFPSMTQTSVKAMGELGKMRYDLFRQYIQPAAPDIQKKVTEKALAFSLRIIRRRAPDNSPRRYHRSVEYNAILLMGELGTAYSREGVKPLPQANQYLAKLSKSASQKRAPAYMQAGALVGLSRHARNLDQLPPANQKATIEALVMAAGPDAVEDSAGRLTRDWLRGRAATGLAMAARKAPDPRIVSALIKLVGDDSLTLDTRATISANLADLQLPADGSGAKAVLALAGKVSQEESEEAIEFEELRVSSGGRRNSDFSHIKSDRFRFVQENSRWEYLREPLIARLHTLQLGLDAVGATAGDNAQAVQTASSEVGDIITLAASDEAGDLDLSDALKSLGRNLARFNPAGDEAHDEHAEEDAGLF